MLRTPAFALARRSGSPDAGIRAERGRYTPWVDFINLPLLAASALVFASVLTGLLSARIGFSFLLVFLLAGILAGEDGIGGYRFDDFRLSFWVGNLALAVILLDGGLRTAYARFRTGLRPAALLATVGVVVCAGITAVAGVWFVDLEWRTALLLGAIVGSTDAAAVFALLARSGVTLNERVAATLEIESGMNDPMAIYLTLVFIALLGPGEPTSSAWSTMAIVFVQQFGWGALVGVVGGFAMAALLRRVASRDAGGGILALLIGAGGLSMFAVTGLLGGSGFLAVYLFGLIVANRAAEVVAPTLAAMDGYAWLAQAGMFLLLGLLVTPSTMLGALGSGLAVSLTLIFVARPVAVWLCLMPFRFSPRETWFIAWVGLRGAVPIVLALFPLLAGTPNAGLLFNIAFMVVLASLLDSGHDDRPAGAPSGGGAARSRGRTRPACRLPGFCPRPQGACRLDLRFLRPARAGRCGGCARGLDGRRIAPAAGGRRQRAPGVGGAGGA